MGKIKENKIPCNKKYFVYNREAYNLSFLLWYHSIGLGLSLLRLEYLLLEISGLDRSSEKHGWESITEAIECQNLRWKRQWSECGSSCSLNSLQLLLWWWHSNFWYKFFQVILVCILHSWYGLVSFSLWQQVTWYGETTRKNGCTQKSLLQAATDSWH